MIDRPESTDPFGAARTRYEQLLAARDSGALSPASFESEVAELRVQDDQGTWWTIAATTGQWLRWDGEAWVEAPRPKTPGGSGLGHEVAQSLRRSTRASLAELPGMVTRQLLARLPVVTLTSLSVWALHSVLLVWKNEGFNCQDPWGPYLNCVGSSGSAASSAAIWGLPIALFWSTVISFLRVGPAVTIRTLFRGPSQMLAIPFRGGADLAGFSIGGGIALLLGQFFGLNRQAGAALTFAGVFLIGGYPGMLLTRALVDLWNQVAKPRTSTALRGAAAHIQNAMMGLAPGFLLLAILPPKLRGVAALALVGAGIYLLNSKGTKPPQAIATPLPGAGGAPALLAWLLSSSILAVLLDLLAVSAEADDGGSNEIQGGDGTQDFNWTNAVAWWNSAGSGRAIGQGLSPSAAAAAAAGLIPPLAPPTDGLVIVDDVIKGRDTEEGEHFRYEADVRQTSDTSLIPADGRTRAEFVAIVRTNDPEWDETRMMRTAQFAFTAPTGFALQPVEEFTDGSSNGAKRVKVVCVPPTDAAFAPGTIPGAVYLYASCPEGTVNGHAQVQIQVGGGELVLNPLDRSWLRGPVPGQPPDSLYLFARLQWPDYCTGYTEAEQQALNATITLKALGERATYIAGCETSEPAESWRRFRLEPNPALLPEHLKGSPSVDLGLEGRIMGGLLQKVFPLQVLCAPRIVFDPETPFLVPEALEEVEVKAAIEGAAPGEEWQVDPPAFFSGDQEIVLPGSVEPKGPAAMIFRFRLGALPKERDEASATFNFKARLTRPVKDYTGPTETEETKLLVNVRRPGLVFLTKMPVVVPGDGKTEAKVQITVIRYTPGEGGKPGVLSVDEAALKPKALTFAREVEAEGAASDVYRAAALQLTYTDVVGEGLNRHATYSIRGSTVVPGTGQPVLGTLDVSAPVPAKADERDYTRPLSLSLSTVKVDGSGANYAAARGKYKDYNTEKKLFLQALDDSILRPYSTIQSMRGNMHILEWATEWVQSFVAETPDSSLQKLMDIYTDLKKQVDEDPRHDASLIYQRRKELIERSTLAWAAVANSEGNIGTVMAGGEWVADKSKWLSEAIFPKLMEIYLGTLGASPKLADLGASFTGLIQAKVVHEFAGNFAQALLEVPDPWPVAGKKTWDKINEEFWPSLVDLLWGALLEKPYEGKHERPDLVGPAALTHGIKIKLQLYFVFCSYKFLQHWLWDLDENKQHKDVWTAFEETAADLAGKTLADTCEWFIGEVPAGAAGSARSNTLAQIREKSGELRKFLLYVEYRGEHG